MNKKRKVVLIGTGFVGMSMAYSLLNQGGCDEIVLIDLDNEKAIGEAMDLSHGLPYAPKEMNIKAGTYEECQSADIVVITAGAAQKPNQTRLDLIEINTRIMKSIVEQIMANGFNGIMIIASNPVDILSYVAQKVSGLPPHKVIGSGTLLDSARLRYLMSEYLEVSSDSIHAYILGEHGDSSFVPWTHCYVGCKSMLEYLDEKHKNLSDLHDIYAQVQQAAYEIINRKNATYYGIGVALTRLILAIFNNENTILTVSSLLNGEFNQHDLYTGVPAIINRDGIKEIITLDLNDVDQAKFDHSSKVLKKLIHEHVNHLI